MATGKRRAKGRVRSKENDRRVPRRQARLPKGAYHLHTSREGIMSPKSTRSG